MVKSGIKIYVRIKPTKKRTGVNYRIYETIIIITLICRRNNLQVYEVGETEDSTPTLSFFIPRSEASGYVNNKKENYIFGYLLDPSFCLDLPNTPTAKDNVHVSDTLYITHTHT